MADKLNVKESRWVVKGIKHLLKDIFLGEKFLGGRKMEHGICELCLQKKLIDEETRLCDCCWELKRRIEFDTNLALIVLDKLGYVVKRKRK